jgi:pimeloyl-ACP methyl ester carboxylesterase
MLFWYEAGNSSYRAYIKQLAPRGNVLLLMIRGVFLSVLSQIISLCFYPLYFRRRMWNPPPDPTSTLPTIILVHGLYHNPSGWTLYRRWLKRAGFTNIYAWDRLLWKHTFNDLLQGFDVWVREIARNLPDKPIVLIGHSLGGLIVRAYAQSPNAVENIAGVVTLGTPHQGTKIAVFGLGKACMDIHHRAPLIKRIEEAAVPENIPHLAVYSPIDNIVFPIEALKVPQSGWTYRQTSPISHIYMLYHRPTANCVLEFVRNVGGATENSQTCHTQTEPGALVG